MAAHAARKGWPVGLKSRYVRTRYLRIARLRRNQWYDRIIRHLMLAENDKEVNPDRQTDYRQARIIVSLVAKNDPQPLVNSSYTCFGTHPERVFVKVTADRKAKLGLEYNKWFDPTGNLIAERLDIPDYDPTSELALRWPIKRDSVRDRGLAPPIKWPKAPLRLVVSLTEVRRDGHVYHQEQLECGHSHTEFLGANPGEQSRRCHKCASMNMSVAPASSTTTLRTLRLVQQFTESEFHALFLLQMQSRSGRSPERNQ